MDVKLPERTARELDWHDDQKLWLKTLNVWERDEAGEAAENWALTSVRQYRAGGACYDMLRERFEALSVADRAAYVAESGLRNGSLAAEALERFPDPSPDTPLPPASGRSGTDSPVFAHELETALMHTENAVGGTLDPPLARGRAVRREGAAVGPPPDPSLAGGRAEQPGGAAVGPPPDPSLAGGRTALPGGAAVGPPLDPPLAGGRGVFAPGRGEETRATAVARREELIRSLYDAAVDVAVGLEAAGLCDRCRDEFVARRLRDLRGFRSVCETILRAVRLQADHARRFFPDVESVMELSDGERDYLWDSYCALQPDPAMIPTSAAVSRV